MQDVLSLLDGVRQTGTSQYSAKCPAHEDHQPSLSVATLADRTLMHCLAGCDVADVVGALNLTLGDLFEKRDSNVIVSDEYEYRDTEGRLVYVVERLVPKSFRQRRITDSGEWVWNLEGVPRLLYRQHLLPKAIADNRWVFFVEGEKDVKTLESHGFIGTTCSGGTAGWRPETGGVLTGAKVVLVPDNDTPGHKHAQAVASDLMDITEDVRIVNLPGIPEKADVTHFLNGHGGTPQQLRDLVLRAPSYLPTPTRTLSQVKPHEVEWMWRGLVPRGKFTILAGPQGQGKSQLSILIAAALSRGHGLPGITQPASTLFITYEDDPNDTIRPRAEAAGADLDRIYVWDARLDPFDVRSDVPRLKALLKLRPDIALIVVDPLVSGLSLDDAYRETEVRSRLGQLLSLDRTVLGIMHLTKNTDANKLYRVAGSVAFTALARSVLEMSDGWVTVIKSNLAAHVPAVRYWMSDGRLVIVS